MGKDQNNKRIKKPTIKLKETDSCVNNFDESYCFTQAGRLVIKMRKETTYDRKETKNSQFIIVRRAE
jgi:hypothetical protein